MDYMIKWPSYNSTRLGDSTAATILLLAFPLFSYLLLSLEQAAPIPPPADLPRAQGRLHRQAEETREADSRSVADAGRAEGEFSIGRVDVIGDLGEGVDVDESAQQALPEDEDEDEPDVQKGEEGLHDEEDQIQELQS